MNQRHEYPHPPVANLLELSQIQIELRHIFHRLAPLWSLLLFAEDLQKTKREQVLNQVPSSLIFKMEGFWKIKNNMHDVF